MNKLLITSVLILVIPTIAFAQDPDDDFGKPKFKPGLYLSVDNFLNNDPIDPYSIETSLDPEDRQFYMLLLQEKAVIYKVAGEAVSVRGQNLWGYCDGKSVYINKAAFPVGFFEGQDVTGMPWARVDIFGTLCLIHYVRNISQNNSQRSKRVTFILDARTGKIHKGTTSILSDLIADDPSLQKELKKSKEEEDINVILYLKKFNQRYPHSFLY